MQVLKFPNKSLFSPTKTVSVFGEELLTLFEAMWTTMIAAKGVGLAGNQVGLTFSMVTMFGPDDEKIFLANPKITKRSLASARLREGCLSAPGDFLELIERSEWVQVEYQDQTGKSHTRVFRGMYSVCIQHEIDHLLGKSFLESPTLSREKRREMVQKWNIKNRK